MIWKHTDAEFAKKTYRRIPLRSPRRRVSNPYTIHTHTSHEGATGARATSPDAPSGLSVRGSFLNHGLMPVATSCRPFGTHPKEATHA